MCKRLNNNRPMLFSADDFQLPSPGYPFQKPFPKAPPASYDRVHEAWLASRVIPRRKGTFLEAGSQRPLTSANFKFAYTIAKECAYELLGQLWSLHPIRTALMMSLNILRGFFPAFRGYSQAMIIDEVSCILDRQLTSSHNNSLQLQSLITSGHFTWSRLLRLMAGELSRRVLESLVESFAYVTATY